MSSELSHDVEPWVPAWDGATYAANTAHHRAQDEWFLAPTPLAPGDRVLDLGCGSGDFTAVLADRVGPGGHVVGLDAQPSMLDVARSVARPQQSFVLGPVQQLGTLLGADHDATFDVVLSRAALHWVPAADQPGVYRDAARLVRPGGWVRVECGGAGNVGRMRALLDDVSAGLGGPTSPWTFADAGTAREWVEDAGLDPEAGGRGYVRTVAQRRPFDRAALEGWLESQAFQAYEATLPAGAHAAFRAEVLARLDETRRADGSLDLTYVRLDLLAQRPTA